MRKLCSNQNCLCVVFIMCLLMMISVYKYMNENSFQDYLPKVRELHTVWRGIHKRVCSSEKHILITGYPRGGTTMLGEVLGFRNDTFYVYEPVHGITTWGFFKDDIECSIIYGNCTILKSRTQDAIRVIKSAFNCNISYLSKVFKNWQVEKSANPKIVNVKQRMKICKKNSKACFASLETSCMQSKVRAMKVLRFTLSNLEQLMEEDPCLHVIHMFRDPRPVIYSRWKIWREVKNATAAGAETLCKKMQYDLKEGDKIASKFPGQIYGLIYENFVREPFSYAIDIFKSIGIPFTINDRKHLLGMVKSNSSNGYAANTVRRDAYATSQKWLKSIPVDLLDTVNKYCQHIYANLDFPKYSNIRRNLTSNNILKKIIGKKKS